MKGGITGRQLVWLLATMLVVAVLDLGTKRWAQHNLATPMHLLAEKVPEGAEGLTVSDVLRARCTHLREDMPVYRLARSQGFEPGDSIYQEGVLPAGTEGLVVFPNGKVDRGYARLVPVDQKRRLLRWVTLALPRDRLDEGPRLVNKVLNRVTLRDFLLKYVPELGESDADSVARKAVFPFDRDKDRVSLEVPVRPGDVYLLGFRAIEIVPGHLDLSYAENPAGAWGMFAGSDPDTRATLFFLLTGVAVFAVFYFMFNLPSRRPCVLAALGAVLGGAVGNVVDRATLGYVVDFIHMYWGSYHWPRYNVADVAITVGVLVLLFVSSKSDRRDSGHAAEG